MRRIIGLVLFGFSATVAAYGDGSRVCHADDILMSPMGDPAANMGYVLTATPFAYTPGQPLALSLENVIPSATVRGVLIYVEDPDALDGEMKPIKRGNFAVPYPAGMQAVSAQYQNCDFAGLTPVLTHTSDAEKSVPIDFIWQPPAIDTGSLRVRAIALMTFGAYQMLELELPLDPVFNSSFE